MLLNFEYSVQDGNLLKCSQFYSDKCELNTRYTDIRRLN